MVMVVGEGGLLLLLDVALTYPSDTGRRFIPGWMSSRAEWRVWFTSIQIHFLYFPHKPFSFQAPLLLLWNAALLGTKHCGSLCECVFVCERGLIPCYPKTFFFFCKSGFQSRRRAEPFLCFFWSLWCRPPTTGEDSVQSLFTMQTLLTFCSLPIFQLCVLWRIAITIHLTEYKYLIPSCVCCAAVTWIKTLVL